MNRLRVQQMIPVKYYYKVELLVSRKTLVCSFCVVITKISMMNYMYAKSSYHSE